MSDLLQLVRNFRTYIHYMCLSVIEEKRAIATLKRIYRPNNEVSTNVGKLPRIDRLDKKLEDYAAQLRLLDELENAINFIEQEQEEEKENDK